MPPGLRPPMLIVILCQSNLSATGEELLLRHGLMAFNCRNRIKEHTDKHAGNYENLILYYPPNDTSAPSHIRLSLREGRRVVTTSRTFQHWELASSDVALQTNWTTFASFRDNKKHLVLPNCTRRWITPTCFRRLWRPASCSRPPPSN